MYPGFSEFIFSNGQLVYRYTLVRGRKQAYTHAHRCVGHSATVRHLDWSADSLVIATDGADYELLYWVGAVQVDP
jgi:hypothetical protein